MMPPPVRPDITAAAQPNLPYAPAQQQVQPHPAGAIPQPPQLRPGTLLVGRYRVLGYLGGGGFAHIYDAHDTVLGHRRAIKEAFAQDPNTQQQFQLEAEFVLNARHPNLVRGYAWFAQGGRYYLVMDYVDGPTIEEYAIQQIHTTGRPLPEERVLDWMMPICDAAHALHAQPTPIIHRDIKPANIKLTSSGQPMLIDLGLAKLYAQGTRTIGAALAFTPGYAPPEQYQASGATDARTDVYALGATLYFLLTGYQPTESPARVAAHAMPYPRVLNPALSTPTEALVLRAMALDPAERQQSAAALLADLQQARAALVDAAPLAGGTPPSAATVRAPQPAPDRVVAPAPARAATAERQPPAAGHARAGGPQGPSGQGTLWALPAAVSRLLATRAAPAPDEARAAVAAMLALAFLALSLLALVAAWAIVFVLPALVLAAFSLSRLTSHSPPEVRGLAFGACIAGTTWVLAWVLILLRLAH
jgi:hypothetical protein